MSGESVVKSRNDVANGSIHELAAKKTPARVFVERAGGGYLTTTQLQLRADHAAAKDAVQTELQLADFDSEFVSRYGLFSVQTQAASKADYLLHPNLGRSLSENAIEHIRRELSAETSPLGSSEQQESFPSLQIVLGDGLSAIAVRRQVPGLLPLLLAAAEAQQWSVGRPFLVRYCRVGVMNDIGSLLRSDVVVLLIGERPGLATAESLSAYMAYRPQPGDTDARRNLISNIHARGVSQEAAVVRILDLARQMVAKKLSGVDIKERLPGKGMESPLNSHSSPPRLPE